MLAPSWPCQHRAPVRGHPSSEPPGRGAGSRPEKQGQGASACASACASASAAPAPIRAPRSANRHRVLIRRFHPDPLPGVPASSDDDQPLGRALSSRLQAVEIDSTRNRATVLIAPVPYGAVLGGRPGRVHERPNQPPAHVVDPERTGPGATDRNSIVTGGRAGFGTIRASDRLTGGATSTETPWSRQTTREPARGAARAERSR